MDFSANLIPIGELLFRCILEDYPIGTDLPNHRFLYLSTKESCTNTLSPSLISVFVVVVKRSDGIQFWNEYKKQNDRQNKMRNHLTVNTRTRCRSVKYTNFILRHSFLCVWHYARETTYVETTSGV